MTTKKKKPVRRPRASRAQADARAEEVRRFQQMFMLDSTIQRQLRELRTAVDDCTKILTRLTRRPLKVHVGTRVYGEPNHDPNAPASHGFALVPVPIGYRITERFIDHSGTQSETFTNVMQPSMAIIARGALLALIPMNDWQELKRQLGSLP